MIQASRNKRRCRNRFSSHRLCRLLLTLAAVSILPCSVSLGLEEDNEIFTVREDSSILKEVKKSPDFVESEVSSTVTSSTVAAKKDLEETIRDSVKTEIELEQNISGFLDVLKDIPEADVRQKLTEEILVVEKTPKSTKDLPEDDTESHLTAAEMKDIIQPNEEIINGQAQSNKQVTGNDESDASLINNGAERDIKVGTHLRGARNLIADFEEKSNSLEDIEDILDSSENVRQGSEIHNVNEPPPVEDASIHAFTSDNSLNEKLNDIDESPLKIESNNTSNGTITNKWNLTNPKDENDNDSLGIISVPQEEEKDSDESQIQNMTNLKENNEGNLFGSVEEQSYSTGPPLPHNENDLEDTTTLKENNDESLSRSSEEESNSTGPPLLHNENDLEDITTLKENNDESLSKSADEESDSTEPPIIYNGHSVDELMTPNIEVSDTTVANIETSSHIVIKKQGVSLFDEIELNENPLISPKEEHAKPDDTREKINDVVQPEVEEIQEELPTTAENSEEKVNDDEVTTVETLEKDVKDTVFSTTSIVAELDVSTTEGTTLKGYRSVNGLTNKIDDASATLLESFLPQNAERSINDNLADERSAGVGKALPTRSINQSSMERYTIPIVVCSGIALLFIVVSFTLFLKSYRQQGTLDIELQEQRCGKDNLDEEEYDGTSIKLLEIELPSSSGIDTADETDECL